MISGLRVNLLSAGIIFVSQNLTFKDDPNTWITKMFLIHVDKKHMYSNSNEANLDIYDNFKLKNPFSLPGSFKKLLAVTFSLRYNRHCNDNYTPGEISKFRRYLHSLFARCYILLKQVYKGF